MANFDKTAHLFDTILFKLFYKRFHRQCFKFIKKYIEHDFKILDVACGTGNFLNLFIKNKKGVEFFGIDQSDKMLEIGRRSFRNIKLIQAEAEKLPFQNNYFDFVSITDSFCYFKDKKIVLSECSRVLKPTGFLFIYTPSSDHILTQISLYIAKLFRTERGAKNMKLKDIRMLTDSLNFKLIKKKLRRYPFSPLFKCWFLLFQK